MKKILLVLAAGFISCSVFGQGAVVMNTRGTGITAPATNIVTGQLASGATYLAQLFYAPAGTTDESAFLPCLTAPPASGGVVAAPATFGTGANAGYILTSTGGGNRFVDPAVVAPGADTAFQLRAWEATLGNTWSSALATWRAAGTPSAVLGKSVIMTAKTSPTAIVTPSFLTGMPGYALVPVPEPGVLALGALGVVALLWRRRK